jgi:hypothetical protein
MKKLFLFISFLMLGFVSWGQRASSKNSNANLTQEQRLTKATDRKTKGGKKSMSMEKKVKTAKKEDKKARKTKAPKSQTRKPKR